MKSSPVRFLMRPLILSFLLLGLLGACDPLSDSATPSPVPTASPTAVPTVTPTPVSSATPTASPAGTATPAPGATASPVPGTTATPSPTPVRTATPVPAATASPTATPTAAPTVTPTPAPVATASPTPAAPTATPTPSPVPTATPDVSAMRSASTIVADMGIGWNLGNSLDTGAAETYWGNPVVTQALLNAVKAAGFKAVRIPITWAGHMGGSPDYTIDSAWMTRVKEVVGYAHTAGLYVIINVHHDGQYTSSSSHGWLTLVDAVEAITNANNTAVQTQFTKVWTQISTAFKDYDDWLIFESMNEVHVGYGAPVSGYYTIINNLNQVFVTLVRNSGSKNTGRVLVLPGYNTDPGYTIAGFAKPTDTATDKLVLSVHFYQPWNFAGSATSNYWGGNSWKLNANFLASSASATTSDDWDKDEWAQEAGVNTTFTNLKSFADGKGMPVIFGEYGAVKQTGYEDYQRYYLEYVTKAAHDRGFVPFLWDNNSSGSGNEAFGFINRSTNTVRYTTAVDAIIRAVTSTYLIGDITKPAAW